MPPKKRTSGNLVIVESPAKAKTIERYLGPGYTVTASYGHVRDLPEKKLGVDVDHDFAPHYEPLKERRKELEKLADQARKAETIRLRAMSTGRRSACTCGAQKGEAAGASSGMSLCA